MGQVVCRPMQSNFSGTNRAGRKCRANRQPSQPKVGEAEATTLTVRNSLPEPSSISKIESAQEMWKDHRPSATELPHEKGGIN